MKKVILLLCACVSLTGCTTINKNPSAAQLIAKHAAFDVSDVLLTAHPDWQPKFQQAANQLALIEAQPTLDVAAVIAILQQIPAPALQTPRARIAFDSGLLVVELVGDPALNPQSEAALRVVVHGLWLGLTQRLALTPAPAK